MDYVEAIPVNGDVRHAVHRSWAGDGSHRHIFARSLCGVRGQDAWGGGGMMLQLDADGEQIPFTATDANPAGKTGWDGRTINEWCPKCIAKLKRKVAADAV